MKPRPGRCRLAALLLACLLLPAAPCDIGPGSAAATCVALSLDITAPALPGPPPPGYAAPVRVVLADSLQPGKFTVTAAPPSPTNGLPYTLDCSSSASQLPPGVSLSQPSIISIAPGTTAEWTLTLLPPAAPPAAAFFSLVCNINSTVTGPGGSTSSVFAAHLVVPGLLLPPSRTPSFRDVVVELPFQQVRSAWGAPVQLPGTSPTSNNVSSLLWNPSPAAVALLASVGTDPSSPAGSPAATPLALTVSGQTNVTLLGPCFFGGSSGGGGRIGNTPAFTNASTVYIGAVQAASSWVDPSGCALRVTTPSFAAVCGDGGNSSACPGGTGSFVFSVVNGLPPGLPSLVSLAYNDTTALDALLWQGAGIAVNGLPANVSCPTACPVMAPSINGGPSDGGGSRRRRAAGGPSSATVGGITYSAACAATGTQTWTDPASGQCRNASSPLAARCAYGAGDNCTACPSHLLCLGGPVVWPRPGYWSDNDRSLARWPCEAPATERCLGFDAELGTTRCGAAYTGTACGSCVGGYYADTATGACLACPTGGVWEKIVRPILILLGGLIAAGAVIFGVIVAVMRRIGGTVLGGGKRALKFCSQTWILIQVFVQVGKTSKAARVPVLQKLYDGILVFHFELTSSHPACNARAFQAQYVQFVLILLMVAVLAVLQIWWRRWFNCHWCGVGRDTKRFRVAGLGPNRGRARTGTEGGLTAKINNFRARASTLIFQDVSPNARLSIRVGLVVDFVRPRVRYVIFTLLTILYATVTNTTLDVIYCVHEPITVRTYLASDNDGTALAEAGIALARPGVCDPSTCDILLQDVWLLKTNTQVVCFEGEHRTLFRIALAVLIMYSIGYPLGSFLLLWRRIRQVMERGELAKHWRVSTEAHTRRVRFHLGLPGRWYEKLWRRMRLVLFGDWHMYPGYRVGSLQPNPSVMRLLRLKNQQQPGGRTGGGTYTPGHMTPRTPGGRPLSAASGTSFSTSDTPTSSRPTSVRNPFRAALGKMKRQLSFAPRKLGAGGNKSRSGSSEAPEFLAARSPQSSTVSFTSDIGTPLSGNSARRLDIDGGAGTGVSGRRLRFSSGGLGRKLFALRREPSKPSMVAGESTRKLTWGSSRHVSFDEPRDETSRGLPEGGGASSSSSGGGGGGSSGGSTTKGSTRKLLSGIGKSARTLAGVGGGGGGGGGATPGRARRQPVAPLITQTDMTSQLIIGAMATEVAMRGPLVVPGGLGGLPGGLGGGNGGDTYDLMLELSGATSGGGGSSTGRPGGDSMATSALSSSYAGSEFGGLRSDSPPPFETIHELFEDDEGRRRSVTFEATVEAWGDTPVAGGNNTAAAAAGPVPATTTVVAPLAPRFLPPAPPGGGPPLLPELSSASLATQLTKRSGGTDPSFAEHRRSIARLSMKLATAALGAGLHLSPHDVRPDKVPPSFFVDNLYELKSNKSLAHFTASDLRASQFWFRNMDMLMLFCLACLSTYWPEGGGVGLNVGLLVLTWTVLLVPIWLISTREPYLPSEKWLHITKLSSLVLAAFAAVTNCVNNIDMYASGGGSNGSSSSSSTPTTGEPADPALRNASNIMSYATFSMSVLLGIVFFVSFWTVLIRGAFKEQQRITLRAIAKANKEQAEAAARRGGPGTPGSLSSSNSLRRRASSSVFDLLQAHGVSFVDDEARAQDTLRLSVALKDVAGPFNPQHLHEQLAMMAKLQAEEEGEDGGEGGEDAALPGAAAPAPSPAPAPEGSRLRDFVGITGQSVQVLALPGSTAAAAAPGPFRPTVNVVDVAPGALLPASGGSSPHSAGSQSPHPLSLLPFSNIAQRVRKGSFHLFSSGSSKDNSGGAREARVARARVVATSVARDGLSPLSVGGGADTATSGGEETDGADGAVVRRNPAAGIASRDTWSPATVGTVEDDDAASARHAPPLSRRDGSGRGLGSPSGSLRRLHGPTGRPSSFTTSAAPGLRVSYDADASRLLLSASLLSLEDEAWGQDTPVFDGSAASSNSSSVLVPLGGGTGSNNGSRRVLRISINAGTPTTLQTVTEEDDDARSVVSTASGGSAAAPKPQAHAMELPAWRKSSALARAEAWDDGGAAALAAPVPLSGRAAGPAGGDAAAADDARTAFPIRQIRGGRPAASGGITLLSQAKAAAASSATAAEEAWGGNSSTPPPPPPAAVTRVPVVLPAPSLASVSLQHSEHTIEVSGEASTRSPVASLTSATPPGMQPSSSAAR